MPKQSQWKPQNKIRRLFILISFFDLDLQDSLIAYIIISYLDIPLRAKDMSNNVSKLDTCTADCRHLVLALALALALPRLSKHASPQPRGIPTALRHTTPA